jgi:hypothetical protein
MLNPQHELAQDAGTNFVIPVPGEPSVVPSGDAWSRLSDDLSRAIVEAETKTSQWTLMHRWVGVGEHEDGLSWGG